MIKYYTRLIQYLAKRYIARHQPIIIGVTGSAGKSSAVTAIGATLTQMLSDKHVYYPSRQLNGELGLPLTIFQIEYFGPTFKYVISTLWHIMMKYWDLNNSISLGRGTKPYDIIVLEYGVDHVGEMDALIDIARPDYGVITNIDTVHFGDPEITRAEKSKMIQAVKNKGYVSIDDIHGQKFVDDSKKEKLMNHIHGFTMQADGEEKEENDILLEDYTLSPLGVKGSIILPNHKTISISTNSIEPFYLLYAAIGYHIALSMGAKICENLDLTLHLPPSRASVLSGINDSIIIDSSYNSSPVGTMHLLDLVEQLHTQLPDYGLITIIGDMRELYELTQVSHLQLAQRLKQMKIDFIGLVGESTQQFMLDPLTRYFGDDHIHHHASSIVIGQRVRDIIANDSKKYIIILKGSQNTIFLEEAVKQLLQHHSDEELICRQSAWWMIKKQVWFDQHVV